MQRKPTKLALALAGILALTVAGCGGGGGTSASSTTTTTTTATTSLSGVAATGAAFTDATVTVMDSRGQSVGSGTVGADGTFTITLAAGAVAPFILTATRTSADGATESLVSVVPTGTGTTAAATVNISPVTNLIASRLSSSGDPTKLGAELAAGTSTVNATTVAATVADVQTILAPILTATGTTGTDPLTGTFAADGTGYDRLLDSIKVTIVPASTTSTNVEIGIKQQQADTAQPIVIPLVSGTGQTAAASITPIAIDPTKLIASGTAAKIAAHLAQLTNCYALPLAQRVNSSITNGLATGTEANVLAAACRESFFGTTGPAIFLSNGSLVGRDANDNGAFASLFKEGATGYVFSQGAYEFTRNNATADIVVSYKGRDVLGNEKFDTFVLREDTDGKLKQIGNQYTYGGGVAAYQQQRNFINQSASDYYSTGYTLNVPLISGVAYVKVTTPKTTVLTLIPGSDGMVFPKLDASRQPVDSAGIQTSAIASMVPSGTNYLRIRSEYLVDTATTAAHPATRESGLFFTPTDAADSEISTYANQSVWKFQYYNSSNTQLGTDQFYKTRVRARTLAEVRTQKWANLDAATLAGIQANWGPNTATPPTNYTKLSATANVAPTWEVPAGALPPTQITLFGNTRKWVSGAFVQVTPATSPVSYVKTSFNDSKSVGSTLRTTTIPCANGNSELHCNTAPSAGYQSYASMSGLHLWARDTSGNEFARFYAAYNLP